MSTLIWAIKGPASGQFLEVTEEEAEQAAKDGWAERVEGRDGDKFTYAEPPGDHAKAEKFLSKRPGYATRELRPEANPASAKTAVETPAEPKAKEPEKPAEPKADEKETTEDETVVETKPAAKPAAKRK